MSSVTDVDIAVLGAGPYGLSLAAHLRPTQRRIKVFGQPMSFWRNHMPRGMCLKSDGFASSLSAPGEGYPLQAWCQAQGVPYADMGLPVTLETFCDYAEAFQRKLVPDVDPTLVQSVTQQDEHFSLTLSDGGTVQASRVVVATGIKPFAYVPEALRGLPASHLSHSSQHTNLSLFAGRHVAVLGGGASAGDTAGLLQMGGARAELVSRHPVRFHNPPVGPRSLVQRLRQPDSGLGPGWKSFMCTNFPLVFHALPESLRLRAVERHLGPAPGWFVRDQVLGKLPVHEGWQLRSATLEQGQVALEFLAGDGSQPRLRVDHVIAATGYRSNLDQLDFLAPSLRERIRTVARTPVLDRHFQSSVPGLYFAGAIAANSFGPLLRFAYGADFAARRLARALA